MCGHVTFQTAIGGEHGVTDKALVGLETGVGADVGLENT